MGFWVRQENQESFGLSDPIIWGGFCRAVPSAALIFPVTKDRAEPRFVSGEGKSEEVRSGPVSSDLWQP